MARSRRSKKDKPSVSVVVLAFNEEGNLEPAVETIRQALNGRLSKHEIIIVNDGSCDDTGAVADRLAEEDPQIRAIHNSRNMGCGDAFMRGVESATCEYVWLMPGDGEISPESVRTIARHIGTTELVLPYASNPSVRPLYRRVISWGFTTLTNVLFGLRLRYYTGPFVIRRSLIKPTRHPTSPGFAFMAPLVVRPIRCGCSFTQVGMMLHPRAYGRPSASSLRNILTGAKTLLRLYWDVHVGENPRFRKPDGNGAPRNSGLRHAGDRLAFVGRAGNRYPSILVFAFFLAFTAIVYRSSLLDIPRSDHIAVFSIFEGLSFPSDAAQIAFMEFFGHARFQPLAWLTHYFEIQLFGSNFLLYHLLVVAIHALNGMLTYKLVFSLTRKRLLSFLAAFLFVSLFTHLPVIAWPLVIYSPLSVTLSLLAVLSLLRFYRESRPRYLYVTYALCFVALFLYELNLMVAGFIFLLSVVLAWPAHNRWGLVFRNLVLVAAIYVVYGALYMILMPKYAGLPEDMVSSWNVLNGLAAVPIEFFNTVFLHNVFASSEIVIDELIFAVPFSAESFSLTTMDASLVKLNLLVYLALLALVLLARRPYRGRAVLLWLMAAWAFSYTFLIFLGRGVAYTISQMRHAYFPGLLLIVIGAHFYERYFASRETFFSIEHWRTAALVVVALFFVGLNTAKTSTALDDYMEYRAYPNTIFTAARDWMSEPDNEDSTLFLSVSTYPPHEKLAWGADIVPDLFLDSSRVTKNVQNATHALEWYEGDTLPTIRELNHPLGKAPSDDFAITFGVMPHPVIEEDVLEILGSTEVSEGESLGKRWWLRLYFEQGVELDSGEAGRASVALGYSEPPYGGGTDAWVFRSLPVSIKQGRMTHIVLVREDRTFGLIVNGALVDKAQDITDEDLHDLEMPLGRLYRMGYRKPYYAAHTFAEFGQSSFSISDNEVGHVFESIQFNPKGFQEYHMSLDF